MSGSPEDYGRQRRIVKTDEFSSVFRLRPVYRTENFVLYARPNSLGHARLGIVVAKRLAPRAVTRNLVKRITRDIFRRSGLVAADCIVRLNKPLAPKRQAAASSRSLRQMLSAELARLLNSQRGSAK